MNYKLNLCKFISLIIILSVSIFTYNYDYHNVHDLLEYSLDFKRDNFYDIYHNRYDIGYSFLIFLLSSLISFELFFCFLVIVLFSLKIFNYRYKITFLLLYVLTYFNNFELNHLKAAIASTLILFSFNTKKYNFVLLCLASLMHLSASVLLISYLIYNLKRRISYLFIFFLLFFVFYYSDIILIRISNYFYFEEFHFSLRVVYVFIALMLLRDKFTIIEYKIYILIPSIIYFFLSPFYIAISQRIIFLVLPIIMSCLILKLFDRECKITQKFIIFLLFFSELFNFYFLK